MPGLCTYRNADRFGNLFADGSFAQKLYVFCPGKSHKDAYSGNGTTIKKPARRRMVNPHNIETNLAHERKIDVHLLSSSQVIFFGVRLEGSIRDSLHKKLSVTLKKEFRDWANSRVCAHSGNSLVQPPHRRKDFNCRLYPRPCWPSSSAAFSLNGSQACGYDYSSLRLSRITAPVRSISSRVCAVEIKPVSNCDGAK